MNRGSLDTLHVRELYGEWPQVNPYHGPLPERFVSWANRKRARPEDGLHFFTDDNRFECVWKRPDTARRWVEGRVVCGPDFSVWNEMPRAMVTWQTYRSRWLAAALQERGATVIPSVSWTMRYDCMQGVGKERTVAISAYGMSRNEAMSRRGYERLTNGLAPSRILVIGGKMPDWLASDPRVTYRPAGTIGDRQ